MCEFVRVWCGSPGRLAREDANLGGFGALSASPPCFRIFWLVLRPISGEASVCLAGFSFVLPAAKPKLMIRPCQP